MWGLQKQKHCNLLGVQSGNDNVLLKPPWDGEKLGNLGAISKFSTLCKPGEPQYVRSRTQEQRYSRVQLG